MLPYTDPQYLLDRPFFGHHEVSPPPKPDPPSSFFPFSPPTFDHGGFHEPLFTTHLLPTTVIQLPAPPPLNPAPNKDITSPAPPVKGFAGVGMVRKRALRKDRHSKIFTAQGPRDRRMRLSLEVARKFFDLQDALGFDKASKTVQWLLTQSKPAINDLTGFSRPTKGQPFTSGSPRSESSTSECEVVSTISDYKDKSTAVLAPATETNTSIKAKKVKVPHIPTFGKESRAKARERARERTKKNKRTTQGGSFMDGDRPDLLESNSGPFDLIDEESGSYDLKSSLEMVAEAEGRSSPSPDHCKRPVHERVFEGVPVRISGVSGSTPLFDYHQNLISNLDTVNLFQEHWDLHFSGNNLLAPWEA